MEFFFVILKSNIDQGCILLNIKPIAIGEIQTKVSPVRVFYATEKVFVLKS